MYYGKVDNSRYPWQDYPYFQRMFSSRKKFAISFWTAYLIFTCIYMYQNKKDDYKNSEKREATVIGRIEQRGKFHYPEFQFVYNDSTYISSDKLFWTSGWEPGEKLTVIFPEGQPEQAIIYTFVLYWIYMPALLLGFMIFFFIFAMIVIIKWGEGWSMFR
jgi:hypothetical protein